MDVKQGGMESSGGYPHLQYTIDPCVLDPHPPFSRMESMVKPRSWDGIPALTDFVRESLDLEGGKCSSVRRIMACGSGCSRFKLNQ